MPSTNNRALLMELQVFIAENNARRSVMLAAANAQASDGAINERSGLLEATLGTITFDCLDTNSCTIIKVTGGPVRVTAALDANVGPTVFSIRSIIVLSTPVTSLVLDNVGTVPVQYRIIQS
jgi:hypothetical protein